MNPSQPEPGRTWIVLLAPSDRAAKPHRELRPVLTALADRFPTSVIDVALLSGVEPTVSEVLDRAVAAQASDVVLVSAQTLPDRSTDAWFKRVVGHWITTRHVDLPIRLAPPICESVSYVEAIVTAVEMPGHVLTSAAGPLLSPAWEVIPGYSHHVIVCRGPRCSALGAAEVAQTLGSCLAARGLDDEDVLVTQAACLFPCSRGPLLVVHPDDVWYVHLRPDVVPDIVESHLVGGRPARHLTGDRGGTSASS